MYLYVTLQVEGSSPALKIGKLLVKVALPRCDDSQVMMSPATVIA